VNKKVVVPGLIAGVLMLLAGLVLSRVFGIISPSINAEYLNPALFRPWSDPIMSLYFLYPFILGIILAWYWDMTKHLVKGKTAFEKAYKFGLVYWLIAGLPGMFITYSSFQVSLAMVLAWSISGLVNAVIAGFVFAKKLT